MTAAVDFAPPAGPTVHELYVPPDTIRRRTLGSFAGPYTTPDRILEATWLASMRAHRDSAPFNRWVGYYLGMIHRAEALDVPVGAAIDHIYITEDNRAGLTAMLMGALLLRSGIVWKPVIYTDARVKLKFMRRGGRKVIATTEWTMTMAVRAKIAHRWAWQQYPERCLASRALSLFCRDHAADVTVYGHTWDEVRNNEVDADHDVTAELPPRVAELLDQATSADVTSEHIRRVLMPAAKKEKLLTNPVGGGRDLDQALHEAWLAAANREATAQIDAALADVGPARPLPDAPALPQPDDVEHAAAGELHCGCDGELHARTGQHSRPDCKLAQARWGS